MIPGPELSPRGREAFASIEAIAEELMGAEWRQRASEAALRLTGRDDLLAALDHLRDDFAEELLRNGASTAIAAGVAFVFVERVRTTLNELSPAGEA